MEPAGDHADGWCLVVFNDGSCTCIDTAAQSHNVDTAATAQHTTNVSGFFNSIDKERSHAVHISSSPSGTLLVIETTSTAATSAGPEARLRFRVNAVNAPVRYKRLVASLLERRNLIVDRVFLSRDMEWFKEMRTLKVSFYV